jgi:ABC-type amino acid transport substrate-binding protein
MAEPATAALGRIFISYRREETAFAAGWLFDRLADRFGKGQIFKDVDNIEPGDDFVDVITAAVGSCDVLLALIGPEWLTITDDRGRRRLDSAGDFVRLEIEAALSRKVLVIPILVDGATMPGADQLPRSLAMLSRRHALELSPSQFDFDTSRLLKVLVRTLADVQAKPAAGDPRGLAAPPAAPMPVTERIPVTAPTPGSARTPVTAPPAPARQGGRPATAPPRIRVRPRRLRAWWLAAAALLAVLLLGFVLLRPQPSVTVPNPGDASVAAVAERLRQAGLAADVTREASEEVAPGSLVRMAPPAGAEVRRGSRVTLVVSSGPKVTALPPDRRQLKIGFVDHFASSRDNPDSLLRGLDPLVFTDPEAQELRGLNVDLAKALAGRLDATVEFQPLPHFTHSFSEVFKGRLDLGMSVLRDLGRSQQEVDFVDYLDNATVLLVPEGNPAGIRSPDDLCGRTIVRPMETAAGSILADSDRCRERNQPPIVLLTCPLAPGTQSPELDSVKLVACPRNADPLQLLLDGQAHAAMVDKPMVDRAAKRAPALRRLEVAPVKMNGGRYGIAVDRDDRQVRDALQSALRAMMADGTYRKILARWNLQSLALRTATVNGRP